MVAVLAIAVVALVALLVWALLRTPPRPAEQLVIYEQDQGRGGLATPRWQFNLPFIDFVRVLGERLHVHLPESRYDREKLAHSAGISITTIEKLLRGETNATLHSLYLVCQARRIRMSVLLGEVEAISQPDPPQLTDHSRPT